MRKPTYLHSNSEVIFGLFFENFQQGFFFSAVSIIIYKHSSKIQHQPDIVVDNAPSECHYYTSNDRLLGEVVLSKSQTETL